MYKLSEKVAKEAGETSKARSRARGIKTLETMLKQALAGKTINPDEIPPVVSVKAPNAPAGDAVQPTNIEPQPEAKTEPEPQPQPQPPPVTEPSSPASQTPSAIETKINALLERQGEYKKAALASKRSGDTATALQYVKIIKLFDTVLASARNGEEVDLSDMPPHPSELSPDLLKAVDQAPTLPPKEDNTVQQSTEETAEKTEEPVAPKPKPVELPPPETPTTILEALTQRLQKYQSIEANAKAEGNDRKARQYGRISKQYQDAIKAHKAGRPVEFDELPTPPGYPPIPVNTAQAPPPRPPPRAAPKPPAPVPSASSSQSDDQTAENPSPKRSPIKRLDSRTSGNHSNTSVMNKTIEILLDRQKDFKEAAIEAKKAGEIEQAKELLKTFKGIENLLNVARGGLPVDLSSVCLHDYTTF